MTSATFARDGVFVVSPWTDERSGSVRIRVMSRIRQDSEPEITYSESTDQVVELLRRWLLQFTAELS